MTDINIKKVNEDGNTGLAGAVFQLLIKEDGSAYRLVTDSDGIGGLESVAVGDTTYTAAFRTDGSIKSLTNLPDGEYRLDEVHVPEGYINIWGDIDFKIENGTVTSTTAASSDKVTLDTSGSISLLKIENTPGAALPSTGGPGTRLFTIIGSILILGAGVLLWRRRRTI